MKPRMLRAVKTISVFFSVAATVAVLVTRDAVAQTEDLSVLSRWIQWADTRNMLQTHLNSLAFRLLEQRRGRIRQLQTATDWRSRQDEVRSILNRVVGPFPQKTPLNSRTLGVVKKEGYRIEKIVFESVPNFFVTGCLFVPEKLDGKAPAILNVIGHTDIAFRAPMYQQLLLNLVRKGFVVLAMDPVGQGERLQYYDPEQKRSVIGGPTTEHSYVGRQCFLTGNSAARYFTWDGVRAIDYLVSRPEIDPNRIGITGISGGGTQTSYIAAFDDRLAAAAPTCYITGFQRLFESIGPQDAEQNFNAGLANGIDHADFLEVRAPKPTLVVATTRDFFSIQGARETFVEALKAFRALGREGNLSIIEDDFGHGYTKKLREGIYSFFQKHLSNPGSSVDEDVPMLTQEELTVTPTGQVGNSLGGETIFSLNRAQAEKLLARLEQSRQDLASHIPKVRSEAQRISGYVSPGKLSGLVFRGRYPREGYHVEMNAMAGEGQCLVPFLFMVPDKGTTHPGLIYLHPQGKSSSASPGGEIEWFVKQGYAVLAPDLSGTGELGTVTDSIAFLGTQVGRSIVGIRAADILRCVQFLKSRADVMSDSIIAVARRGMAVPLLHAAAFDTSITQVALIEPLLSFQSIVMNRYYSADPGDLVANALTGYDLPDLAASLAPRKLMFANLQDHLSKPATTEMIEKALAVVRRSYADQRAQDNLVIRMWLPFQPIDEIFSTWQKK